jgi:hypothetical protein
MTRSCPSIRDWILRTRGADATVGKRIQLLTNDIEWLSEMSEAFRAPCYDSYAKRCREIIREGWEKKPALSPRLAASGVYLDFFPDMFEIKTYADVRVHQARQAAAIGRIDHAQKIVSEVTAFGWRMSKANDVTDFQEWIGLDLRRRGLEALRQVHLDAGRPDADYGPTLFLAAGVAFLIAFQPFAAVLQQCRSANLPRIKLRNASLQLEVLQGMNPLSYFSRPSADYFIWMVVTPINGDGDPALR